ncbi:hypothetical protein IRJ41_013260 [Triplophysa rosa]|uniref:Uncharacterized protein n=1 Tax=Triplophysa rosa TaxID=992332 RepID=A0A9W8C8X1_TRIRA|nr:hypothetical protein IRJ41_013260 [Triplophysa rosa]
MSFEALANMGKRVCESSGTISSFVGNGTTGACSVTAAPTAPASPFVAAGLCGVLGEAASNVTSSALNSACTGYNSTSSGQK